MRVSFKIENEERRMNDNPFSGGFQIFSDTGNNENAEQQQQRRSMKRRIALRDVSNTAPMGIDQQQSRKMKVVKNEQDDPMQMAMQMDPDDDLFGSATDIHEFGNVDSGAARRIRELEEKNAALNAKIDELKSTVEKQRQSMSTDSDSHVQLQACLYSVGTSSNHVRRTKLGRHASIDTQMKLELAREKQKLEALAENKDAFDAATRLTSYVSNLAPSRNSAMSKEQGETVRAYFKSVDFAKDLMYICVRTSQIFKTESRLLELQSPMYVFGDLHGNLDDLHFFAEKLWTFGMGLTAGTFLCLGDYVDRGPHGLEVVGYLLAQKVLNPHKIQMLRGNHETRAVNGAMEHYKEGSFVWQCLNRFGKRVGQCLWENINKVFDRMPLAATIDGDVFCVHGGIPRPVGHDPILWLDNIRKLPSVMGITPSFPHETEVQQRVAMDLIWADPANSSMEENGALDNTGFGLSPRGSGVSCYGTRAVKKFLQANGLTYIIRAHEPTKEGIHVSKGARVFTVFSTSKNHGCGDDASCGCILIDSGKISMIHRQTEKPSTP